MLKARQGQGFLLVFFTHPPSPLSRDGPEATQPTGSSNARARRPMTLFQVSPDGLFFLMLDLIGSFAFAHRAFFCIFVFGLLICWSRLAKPLHWSSRARASFLGSRRSASKKFSCSAKRRCKCECTQRWSSSFRYPAAIGLAESTVLYDGTVLLWCTKTQRLTTYLVRCSVFVVSEKCYSTVVTLLFLVLSILVIFSNGCFPRSSFVLPSGITE